MQIYPNAVNVGVDVNGFRPRTAKELIEDHQQDYLLNLPAVSQDFLKKAVFVDTDGRDGNPKTNLKERL